MKKYPLNEIVKSIGKTLKNENNNILLIILLFVTIIHLPVIAVRSTNPVFLQEYSADEIVLVDAFRQLQTYILDCNLAELARYPLHYSYGFIYYLSTSLFTLPWHNDVLFSGQVIMARFLEVICTGLALFFVFLIFKLLTKNRISSLIATLSMLSMTGMILYHRFLGPDYMSLMFLIISIYYLCKDNLQMSKDLYFSGVFLALGASIKLSGLMFGLTYLSYWGLCIVYNWKRLSISKIVKKVIFWSVLVVVVFIIANFPAFCSTSNFKTYLDWIRYQSLSNAEGHFGTFSKKDLPLRIMLWFRPNIAQSIVNKFMPLWFLIVCCLSYVFNIVYLLWKKKSLNEVIRQIILFLSFIVPLIYIITSTDKIWDWYLIPVFIFSLFGLISFFTLLIKKPVLLSTAVLLICIMMISFNSSNWIKWHTERISESRSNRFERVYKSSLELEKVVENLLSDPILATDDYSSIRSIILPKIYPYRPYEFDKIGVSVYSHDPKKISSNLVKKNDPDFVLLALRNTVSQSVTKEQYEDIDNLRITSYGSKRRLYPVYVFGGSVLYAAINDSFPTPDLKINGLQWTENKYEAENLFAEGGLYVKKDANAQNYKFLYGMTDSKLVVPFFINEEGNYTLKIRVKPINQKNNNSKCVIKLQNTIIATNKFEKKTEVWNNLIIEIKESLKTGIQLIQIDLDEMGIDCVELSRRQ